MAKGEWKRLRIEGKGTEGKKRKGKERRREKGI